MSSGPTRVRTGWRLVATFGVGALVLASCGTPTVSRQRLNGTPARGIAVPLTNVGCALNNYCVAVGTSSASVGPTSVAEFSTPLGHWIPLALPAVSSPLITSAACTSTQCLLGGSQPNRDLLWRFDSVGHTLGVATAPPGGIGIVALNCDKLNCALVDTNAIGATPRFSSSADGGLTWTDPVDMTWASGDAITSLACGAVFDCVVSARTAHQQISFFITLDGGITWTQRVTPPAWTTLTSLSCAKLRCVALVSASGGSKLVRTKNFGKTWTSVSLSAQANALACTALASCVIVGQHTDSSAWLATVHVGTTSNALLRYVPTPLVNVACGMKVCAAIGVTTLLSVPAPH